MNEKEITERLENFIEQLAAAEHERWSHWQQHMHDQGKRLEDGSLVLPPDLVARWDDQIARAYSKLTDSEKDSDREQVRRYLPLIVDALKSR